MNMIDRKVHRSRSKAMQSIAESQKAFDESISSLVKWLHEAVIAGFMSKDEATQYFKEESERRKNQAKELLENSKELQ